MRENIGLYRGKLKDENKWFYGYLYSENQIRGVEDLSKFSLYEVREVDPETIGQYTGLTDKNGTKIWKGDIVKIYPDCDYPEDFDISDVYSYNGVLCVNYHTCEYDSTAIGFAYDIDETEFEVIGNTTDNPELLEVGENG